ncbi:SEC59/DGK1/VTE5 family protein [Spirulina subsalsa FACHB-351]|uniref:SEC59/DGK1/VTE5 family protein n=1 Tax=Spirulina subsalsa FACHB-351 TaxID=234711 RepID=A0ABT3L4C8_9CYAN|nr:diacylglycerol/polyprenol kinase family protein [Spirulina subsalsa]MCW6036361.1 SEC59/DGK1/VTE5 family protein [Spirulina subsalsa FACHB-351]
MSSLLPFFPSPPSEFATIALVSSYLLVIVVLAEGLNRLSHTTAEFTRKIVHIGSGNVILFAWWLQIPLWIGLGASFVASLVALVSYFVPILPSLNSVGRQSLGTFFYALSIGLLVAGFFPQLPYYGVIGVLVMAWGDGLAALVGQRWGKHKYRIWGNGKSWEGSLTMLGVSFAVTLAVLIGVYGNNGILWVVAGLVAIAATVLESFSNFGLDNLTVPLGSAGLCFYLMSWWGMSL